jgi:hypothetical protein
MAGHGFALLIVDPQVDFHEGGSLAVAGANADAERLEAFIGAHLDEITSIFVTLDSHQVRQSTLRRHCARVILFILHSGCTLGMDSSG